jgi:hypothetical protein
MATEEDLHFEDIKTRIEDLQRRVTAIEQLLREAHIL